MDSSISANLSLVALPAYTQAPLGLVQAERLSEAVEGVSRGLQIKSGNLQQQAVKSLSGGNQQKVVIGKWLLGKPQLFMLDEPTRGVDVGAKYEIYSIIDTLAQGGNSVLFISSELEELMGMCDRILVMSRGEIVGSFSDRNFDKHTILHAAFREEIAA